jgi:hypothetical protein
MRVSWTELENACRFVNLNGGGLNQAFVCKQSGRIYWQGDLLDDFEEVPDDIEDAERYFPVPDKRKLELGRPLVLDFARAFLADDFDEVERIFSHKGAYAQFKALLIKRSMLDQWHDFEHKAEETALRAWCKQHAIELDP